MALQRNPKGGFIIRTPAPDEDARTQNYGGQSYGGAATLDPGQGGPLTLLGKNLRESIDDPAMAEVLAKGTAGRDDEIPADLAKLPSFNANDLPAGGELQTRAISATSYPPTHGATRQQNPEAAFGAAPARPRRVAHKLNANGIAALYGGKTPGRGRVK